MLCLHSQLIIFAASIEIRQAGRCYDAITTCRHYETAAENSFVSLA